MNHDTRPEVMYATATAYVHRFLGGILGSTMTTTIFLSFALSDGIRSLITTDQWWAALLPIFLQLILIVATFAAGCFWYSEYKIHRKGLDRQLFKLAYVREVRQNLRTDILMWILVTAIITTFLWIFTFLLFSC